MDYFKEIIDGYKNYFNQAPTIGEEKARSKFVESFSDNYCKMHHLSKCPAKYLHIPAKDVGDGYVYGRYFGRRVEIYGLTPKTNKPLKIEVLLDTLIHEMQHHLDCCTIGVAEDHQNNFQGRVNNLKKEINSRVQR